MSVTLKLADADAKIIADVLHVVNQYNVAAFEEKETSPYLKMLERNFGSVSMRNHMAEIEGAFNTAVRANSR